MNGSSTSLDLLLAGETFEDKLSSIAKVLANKKNIIVLSGAGISVSCGIPDFRSSNGLYNTLNYQELGLASPEDLFDLETFRDDPRPFFQFAKALYPGGGDDDCDGSMMIAPGPSHEFLSWLDRQKKLLRIYTQNIDALEQSAGVSPSKVVYAHGSLLDATCMKCKAKYDAGDIAVDVRAGTVPLCQRPRNKKAKKFSNSTSTSTSSISITSERSSSSSSSATTMRKIITSSTTETETAAPPVKQRKSLRRSAKRAPTSETNDDDNNNNFEVSMKRGLCCGVIKPNITFFGEKLGNEVGRSLRKDYEKADCLIVMGTSLSVAPMSKVVEYLRPDIPRILINRNIVSVPKVSSEDGAYLFHACLLGNCDDVVRALEKKMKDIGSSQTNSSNADHIRSNGGLVSSHEAWLQNQPKESVLLFPGAVVSGSGSTKEQEPEQQKLVVHCDECQLLIEGKVFCCKTCFDYDLCEVCYDGGASMTHADGKHEFGVES